MAADEERDMLYKRKTVIFLPRLWSQVLIFWMTAWLLKFKNIFTQLAPNRDCHGPCCIRADKKDAHDTNLKRGEHHVLALSPHRTATPCTWQLNFWHLALNEQISTAEWFWKINDEYFPIIAHLFQSHYQNVCITSHVGLIENMQCTAYSQLWGLSW